MTTRLLGDKRCWLETMALDGRTGLDPVTPEEEDEREERKMEEEKEERGGNGGGAGDGEEKKEKKKPIRTRTTRLRAVEGLAGVDYFMPGMDCLFLLSRKGREKRRDEENSPRKLSQKKHGKKREKRKYRLRRLGPPDRGARPLGLRRNQPRRRDLRLEVVRSCPGEARRFFHEAQGEGRGDGRNKRQRKRRAEKDRAAGALLGRLGGSGVFLMG